MLKKDPNLFTYTCYGSEAAALDATLRTSFVRNLAGLGGAPDPVALAAALAPVLAPLLEVDGFDQADADALVQRLSTTLPDLTADAVSDEQAKRLGNG